MNHVAKIHVLIDVNGDMVIVKLSIKSENGVLQVPLLQVGVLCLTPMILRDPALMPINCSTFPTTTSRKPLSVHVTNASISQSLRGRRTDPIRQPPPAVLPTQKWLSQRVLPLRSHPIKTLKSPETKLMLRRFFYDIIFTKRCFVFNQFYPAYEPSLTITTTFEFYCLSYLFLTFFQALPFI